MKIYWVFTLCQAFNLSLDLYALIQYTTEQLTIRFKQSHSPCTSLSTKVLGSKYEEQNLPVGSGTISEMLLRLSPGIRPVLSELYPGEGVTNNPPVCGALGVAFLFPFIHFLIYSWKQYCREREEIQMQNVNDLPRDTQRKWAAEPWQNETEWNRIFLFSQVLYSSYGLSAHWWKSYLGQGGGLLGGSLFPCRGGIMEP